MFCKKDILLGNTQFGLSDLYLLQVNLMFPKNKTVLNKAVNLKALVTSYHPEYHHLQITFFSRPRSAEKS